MFFVLVLGFAAVGGFAAEPPEGMAEAELVEPDPPGTDELRRQFNEQRGSVRLVLLLAPS